MLMTIKCELDGQGSIPYRDKILLFSKTYSLGSIQPLIQWPGPEADQSSPSSAKVERRSCSTIHPYIYMAWGLINEMQDNFLSHL
jgi:hypothetical protein